MQIALRTIRDADVKGKRVLVRVDFNVPLEAGRVVDDTRIRAALPTLEFLQQQGAASITLLAHIGRPKGKVVEALRVAPVVKHLEELLKLKVKLVEQNGLAEAIAEEIRGPFDTQVLPEVVLHENLRFDPREEANDEAFAKELASLGDVFVQDAFAVIHRTHASIVGVPKLLPSFAGLLVEREVTELSKALIPPAGSIAIIGGAKFETKIPLIEKLIGAYAQVLLGGALGNDMLKVRGLPVGASLVSRTPAPDVLAQNQRLILPHDVVVQEVKANAERTTLTHDLRGSERIIDIGPATKQAWSSMVAKAPFVLWNGPLGVYEQGYTDGTDALAAALAKSGTHAVVGGGDTVAALSKYTFDPSRVFISTGGGAMLDFLARGGTLPGLEPLMK